MAQIDLKNATLKIVDGDATPNEIEIRIGEGNFTWSEKKNIDYILDRGVLDEVRAGDEAPVEVSFDFIWDYIKGVSGSTTPSIEAALKKTGEAAAWVTSDADLCKPYAVDLTIYYVPDCATGDTELITFSDLRWEQMDHDLRGATISCSGKCNIVSPTASRQPQSSGS